MAIFIPKLLQVIFYLTFLTNFHVQTAQIPFTKPQTQTPEKLSRSRKPSEPFLKCNPPSFGIPEEKDNRYFPISLNYQNCSLKSPFQISLKNNKISHNCKTEIQLLSKPEEELFGRYPQHFNWQNVSNFPISTSEWLLTRCGSKKSGILRNLFNSTSAFRALSISKGLQSKSSAFRPLTVILLVLDSVSRQSFYRNLKKTVAFLNQDSPNYEVFDFLLNNAQGEKTSENLAPLLYGKNLEHLQNVFNEASIFDEKDWKKFEEYQEKHAIWKKFERQGFVTLFSFDSYTDYVSLFTGRRILADHVNCNFWRAGHFHAGFEDFTEESQCLGNKSPSNFTLEYLLQFSQNYWGINRFAYAHLGVAHESTGRRLRVIDSELNTFLEKLQKTYEKHPEEDIVLMLCSDHGRISLVTSRDSWQEKLLPLHLLILNKNLSKRKNFHENLQKNTERLISRFDWHETLIFLSQLPYENPEKNSLFSKTLLLNRTCLDAEIPSIYCSCLHRKFQLEFPENNSELKEISEKTVEAVNGFLVNFGMIEFCEKISLGKVEEASEVFIKEKKLFASKNLEILFSDFKNPEFRIRVTALVGKKKGFSFLQDRYGLRPVIEKTVFNQRLDEVELITQIISIEQPDSLFCPLLPQRFAPVQGLCKCKSLSSRFRAYFLQQPKNSCQDLCLGRNETCEDFEHVEKNLDNLLKITKNAGFLFSGLKKGDYFGIHEDDLVLPIKKYCQTRPFGIQVLFCVCSSQ
jgi:hypothetical protein